MVMNNFTKSQGDEYSLISDPLLRWCDQVSALCFYVLIIVLPISIALVQWFASLPVLFYLVSFGRRMFLKPSGFIRRPFLNLKNRGQWSQIFLGLWILAMLISVLVSHDSALSAKAMVTKIVQALLVFFLFSRVMSDRYRLAGAFFALMVSLVLVLLSGIFQFFFGEDFLRHSAMVHGRISSSLREPTDFAAYLVLTLPVAMAFLFSKRDVFKEGITFCERLIRSPRLERIGFFLLRATVLVGVICLGLSYTRAGWLSLACVFMGLSVWTRKNLWLCAGVTVVVLGIGGYLIGENRWYLNHATLFSMTGRQGYWQTALGIVTAHPWTGIGLNAYSSYARDYQLPFGGYPHNCYLQMAAEIGIPGTLSFVAFCASLLTRAFGFARKIQGTFEGTLLLGLAFGLFGFLMHSFFDTFFFSSQLRVMMWLYLGAICAILRLHVGKDDLLAH